MTKYKGFPQNPMTKFIERIKTFHFPAYTVPLALLAVTGLAYGVLIPWLGFYWDDWAFIYIGKQLGSEGLARYFATNRPFWGMIYQFTTAVIGPQPWKWQVFGLVWRWLASVSLWYFVRQLWPRRREAALWAALLFIVFPALRQQPIAILYGHFFIVMTAFLLSLALMLKAVRNTEPFLAVGGIIAGLLSLVNLLCMEYFFLLDLLRPVLLWAAFAGEVRHLQGRRQNRLQTLAALAGAVHRRAGLAAVLLPVPEHQLRLPADGQPESRFLRHAGHAHRPGLQGHLDDHLRRLGRRFHPARSCRVRAQHDEPLCRGGDRCPGRLARLFAAPAQWTMSHRHDRRWAWHALLLGALGLLIAGLPFWLTGLQIGLRFPNDRFSISFMLGACFFITGLLGIIPLPRWSKHIILAVLVAFGRWASSSRWPTTSAVTGACSSPSSGR